MVVVAIDTRPYYLWADEVNLYVKRKLHLGTASHRYSIYEPANVAIGDDSGWVKRCSCVRTNGPG